MAQPEQVKSGMAAGSLSQETPVVSLLRSMNLRAFGDGWPRRKFNSSAAFKTLEGSNELGIIWTHQRRVDGSILYSASEKGSAPSDISCVASPVPGRPCKAPFRGPTSESGQIEEANTLPGCLRQVSL